MSRCPPRTNNRRVDVDLFVVTENHLMKREGDETQPCDCQRAQAGHQVAVEHYSSPEDSEETAEQDLVPDSAGLAYANSEDAEQEVLSKDNLTDMKRKMRDSVVCDDNEDDAGGDVESEGVCGGER